MCNRYPTYCGYNLCCCASDNCYEELRNHFFPNLLQLRKGANCVVHRQQWIGNNRFKRLNRSSEKSDQMYERSDCTACVSLVDGEGVEMTCSNDDVRDACRGMDLLVGGPVACSGSGDCCCQGANCPTALQNFYSGHQEALGTPRVFPISNNDHCHSVNFLITAISASLIFVLDPRFHLQLPGLQHLVYI